MIIVCEDMMVRTTVKCFLPRTTVTCSLARTTSGRSPPRGAARSSASPSSCAHQAGACGDLPLARNKEHVVIVGTTEQVTVVPKKVKIKIPASTINYINI